MRWMIHFHSDIYQHLKNNSIKTEYAVKKMKNNYAVKK